jgi:hypothetical protein
MRIDTRISTGTGTGNLTKHFSPQYGQSCLYTVLYRKVIPLEPPWYFEFRAKLTPAWVLVIYGNNLLYYLPLTN